MTRWLIVFALAGASIASAKTYSVTVTEPYVIGHTTLKPGDYKLELKGSQLLFLTGEDKTAAEATVKVENEPQKYENTAILSKQMDNQQRIENIELGGTRMKLLFN
jgi:hypothetical protein